MSVHISLEIPALTVDPISFLDLFYTLLLNSIKRFFDINNMSERKTFI